MLLAINLLKIKDCFCISFLEGDPDNFLTYFKRATVFLAMGRSKAALPDLDRVLELKPDFFQVSSFLIHNAVLQVD